MSLRSVSSVRNDSENAMILTSRDGVPARGYFTLQAKGMNSSPYFSMA